MSMLGHYLHLCLMEEFQKPKDVLIDAITFCIKREEEEVVLMDIMIML